MYNTRKVSIMKKGINLLVIVCVFALNLSAVKAEVMVKTQTITSGEALEKLLDGNNRFVGSKSIHPDQAMKRVIEISKAQHPFAVVIACSDSRVSPEVIFDQGLGDIFVIRDAGNVLDDEMIGSVEYALEHLKVPLVLVLGHEKCGAFVAALSGHKPEGHIASLVRRLLPAIKIARTQKGDLLDNAIRANVKLEVESLKKSKPIIYKLVNMGKVKIIGGYYNIDDGTVKIIAK